MCDFAWRPDILVKQAKLTGGTMPSSAVVALAAGEGGQPTAKVGLGAAEIAPSAPSSVLAKRKWDDSVRTSGHKKSRASMSLCALRQAARLTLGAGCPSSFQDLPLAPSSVEASVPVASVATISPPPPPIVFV